MNLLIKKQEYMKNNKEQLNQIYDLRIIINTEKNTCQTQGIEDAWLQLAILMEAVGMTMALCRDEGIPATKIEKTVLKYFEKVKEDYNKDGEFTVPFDSKFL